MNINKIRFNTFILWEATNLCFWTIFWNLLFELEKGKEGFFNQSRLYYIVTGIILACLQWIALRRISSIRLTSWIIATLIGMQLGTLSIFPAFVLTFLLGLLLKIVGYSGGLVTFLMALMTTTPVLIWTFQAYVLETVQYLGWIKSISWVGIQFLINILSIFTASLIFDMVDHFKLNFSIFAFIFTFQFIVSLFNLHFYYFWLTNHNKAD